MLFEVSTTHLRLCWTLRHYSYGAAPLLLELLGCETAHPVPGNAVVFVLGIELPPLLVGFKGSRQAANLPLFGGQENM